MSNGQNSPPRLPDELIAEIFRNETLSCRDLFHCSLVSREFVETVNKCLYEHILVALDIKPVDVTYGNDIRNTYNYTTSSSKLLKTLLNHQRLAKYVKELEFDYVAGDYAGGSGAIGSETTKPLALSTFLRLGSNVKNVIFGDGWAASRTLLAIVKEHKNVTGLGAYEMDQEEEEYCAQHLPHLKRRYIGEMILNQTGRNVGSTRRWSSLERLDLYDGVTTIAEFPSLSASSSTLRILGLTLNLALQLDYSQFPTLRELHIIDLVPDSAEGDRYAAANSFWRSLCKSPSLHTLVFAEEEFSVGYEKALFHHAGGPPNLIPSLRIIRFETEVRLDRVNSLLSGPLATTLQSFVIPSFLRGPDARATDVNKLRAMALWCETIGVELVLADEPRVRWTLLCKRIFFSCVSQLKD